MLSINYYNLNSKKYHNDYSLIKINHPKNEDANSIKLQIHPQNEKLGFELDSLPVKHSCRIVKQH